MHYIWYILWPTLGFSLIKRQNFSVIFDFSLFKWRVVKSDIQLATTHTGLYLFSVKGKDKNWVNSLASKVLVRFEIELVYSIWKPVIWIFNFSNSLNVQRSSRNVKFDNYREKENPLFTLNVIKLGLFWHKFYYKIHFFIFWKCMLSKVSIFLFMATVNGCLLLHIFL